MGHRNPSSALAVFAALGRSAMFLPALLAALSITPARAADTWPLFRGNSLATGVVEGTLPEKLDVLWKFQGKEGGFEATAVIDATSVYVGSLDGNFYAIDLKTGEKRWEYHTELGFSATAAIADGRVYVGDTEGKFYAFDTKGELLWGVEASAEINSAPNFYKNMVLFGSQDATLYALDAVSGKEAWKYSIGDQIRCSPTIVEGRAMVAGCDGKLHVVRLDDGKEIGSVPIDSPTGSTPAVQGDRLFFGTEGGTFYAIDWRTTKVDWTAKAEKGQSIRSSAAVIDNLVIVGARDKRVHAWHVDDGQEAWFFPTKSRVDSCPVVVGNRVFVGTGDGRLYALDRRTGEKSWYYEAGGQFSASPAVAAGRLIIGNQDGTLYCFGEK